MTSVSAQALRQLTKWETDHTYLGLSLSHVEGKSKGFLTALLYGIAEKKLTLDYYISTLAGRSDIDPTTRNILRIGLYQLLYMQKPDYATVSETVKLARTQGEKGMVNAILRTALRESQRLALPPREKNELRYLSLRHSVPLPLLRSMVADMGKAEAEAYLLACEEKAGLALFVNTTKISRDAYLQKLAEQGIAATLSELSPYGVVLRDSTPVTALPGFLEGWFFVQDIAAQVAVHILSPKPGDVLVDTCAAPGGKSFAAATIMQNKGQVNAFELHPSKLPLILSGAERLGLSIVRASALDAKTPDTILVGKADCVICDVPCSGVGVLRKKPDIRYKNPETFGQIPPLQYEILESSARYLKVGGKLLYATCTIFSEENHAVVSRFLEAYPNYTLAPFTVGGKTHEGELQMYPHTHGTDGFYVALLQKNS